ncbi:hypothetical protein [Dialister hominis]|uniref:hypothetical protein n=1 Tax=Dialister hominis TaxID=2582419 RepID=UPI003FF01E61
MNQRFPENDDSRQSVVMDVGGKRHDRGTACLPSFRKYLKEYGAAKRSCEE